MKGLTKQSAENMEAWLKGAYMPERLEYRVRPHTDPRANTFVATCLDMDGHATYASTQLEALEGCVESVRKTCYRKLRDVIGYLREELPEMDRTEPDRYNVPRWMV